MYGWFLCLYAVSYRVSSVVRNRNWALFGHSAGTVLLAAGVSTFHVAFLHFEEEYCLEFSSVR
jgi:hypothetical protein